jgi:transposase
MSRISSVKPHLTEEEVREKIATAPTARRQQKWMIIHNALVDPRPAIEIAQHTATSLRTVHQVISDYNRLGVAAIETQGRVGKPPSAYLDFEQEAAFLETFRESAQSGHLTTIQEIQQAFETLIGAQVAPSTIYRLLKRHGWRKLMPRPYHPEGDKVAQATFKKNFPDLVQAALSDRPAADQRPVIIMAADEGRFGRLGQVMRAWCAPGIRPQTGQQSIREYLYGFVAVAPALGQMTALVLPFSNTDMMNLFLAQVANEFADYFVVMQVDGASYHTGQDLIIPDNIRLIVQPPRSPELNAVEHIWEEIREKHFYNHIFESLDAVSETLCKGLKSLMDLPKKLQSITNFPHMRVTF